MPPITPNNPFRNLMDLIRRVYKIHSSSPLLGGSQQLQQPCRSFSQSTSRAYRKKHMIDTIQQANRKPRGLETFKQNDIDNNNANEDGESKPIHGKFERRLGKYDDPYLLSTGIIHFCSKKNDFDSAWELLQRQFVKNLEAYNTFISECAKQGYVGRAWKAYNDLKKRKLTPDVYTHSSLIKTLQTSVSSTKDEATLLGHRKRALHLLRLMILRNYEINLYHVSGLLDILGRTGDVEGVWTLYYGCCAVPSRAEWVAKNPGRMKRKLLELDTIGVGMSADNDGLTPRKKGVIKTGLEDLDEVWELEELEAFDETFKSQVAPYQKDVGKEEEDYVLGRRDDAITYRMNESEFLKQLETGEEGGEEGKEQQEAPMKKPADNRSILLDETRHISEVPLPLVNLLKPEIKTLSTMLNIVASFNRTKLNEHMDTSIENAQTIWNDAVKLRLPIDTDCLNAYIYASEPSIEVLQTFHQVADFFPPPEGLCVPKRASRIIAPNIVPSIATFYHLLRISNKLDQPKWTKHYFDSIKDYDYIPDSHILSEYVMNQPASEIESTWTQLVQAHRRFIKKFSHGPQPNRQHLRDFLDIYARQITILFVTNVCRALVRRHQFDLLKSIIEEQLPAMQRREMVAYGRFKRLFRLSPKTNRSPFDEFVRKRRKEIMMDEVFVKVILRELRAVGNNKPGSSNADGEMVAVDMDAVRDAIECVERVAKQVRENKDYDYHHGFEGNNF